MHLPRIEPFAKAPMYFFTACTHARQPLLANVAALKCLRQIWERSTESHGWHVGRFVLMPDHVHFFAQATATAASRAAWTKLWKSVSARSLAAALNIPAPIWQPDTFDHVLRNGESYALKWEYVRNNPVRAGWVERASDWPWQGEICRLNFH